MLIQRLKKRMENDVAVSIHQLAHFTSLGQHGLQRDMGKALDLYLKAGKLETATLMVQLLIYT